MFSMTRLCPSNRWLCVEPGRHIALSRALRITSRIVSRPSPPPESGASMSASLCWRTTLSSVRPSPCSAPPSAGPGSRTRPPRLGSTGPSWPGAPVKSPRQRATSWRPTRSGFASRISFARSLARLREVGLVDVVPDELGLDSERELGYSAPREPGQIGAQVEVAAHDLDLARGCGPPGRRRGQRRPPGRRRSARWRSPCDGGRKTCESSTRLLLLELRMCGTCSL